MTIARTAVVESLLLSVQNIKEKYLELVRSQRLEENKDIYHHCFSEHLKLLFKKKISKSQRKQQ